MAYLKMGTFYLLLGLYGCGTVKRSNEKAVNEQKAKLQLITKEKVQLSSDESLHSFLMERDSLGIEFMVEIWPRGPFNYSPYKGFEGTAQKIIYYGKADQVSSALHKEDVQVQKELNIDLKSELKQETAQKQVHSVKDVERKAGAGWKWMLAGLIAGLLILIWITKKIRQWG